MLFNTSFFKASRSEQTWVSSPLTFLNHTSHPVGPFPTTDRPVAETSTWKHTTHPQTDIHAPVGIRTRILSKRATADLRLRLRGHRERLFKQIYLLEVGRDSSVGTETRYGLGSPDRPWGSPSLLYDVYRVSFPGVKRPGRGVDHSPSSAKVKERVQLCLYSPFGPSWPVLG